MGPRVHFDGGRPGHVDVVDLALEISLDGFTAVVVDHGLHQRQGRRDVVVGDGAGLVLGQGQGDRAVAGTVGAPDGGRVAADSDLRGRVCPRVHLDGG